MKTTLHKIFLTLVIICFTFSYKGQSIYTFAGNGTFNFSGDGLPANNAQLDPIGVAVDASGNVYVADYFNNRIRKINTSGIISTFAGTGVGGFSGDGGLAVNAQLDNPIGVAVDSLGNVYLSDNSNNRIRKINTSGIITTIAGSGVGGFSGDGGNATSANIKSPIGVAVDTSGNIFFSDSDNHRIRKVNTSGIISTYAGNGINSFGGDGSVATSAQFSYPRGIAVDLSENIYVADIGNDRIRKINTSGIISTFAGIGVNSFSGDGGLASNAALGSPYGVATDAYGNIYIADRWNHRIRKVNSSGIISTIAGNGVQGFSGDGGIATNAQLDYPYAVAVSLSGNIYICDLYNERVRVICSNNCLASINSLSNKDNGFSLFPNPNNGSFKIVIEKPINECIIEIYNSLGKNVYTKNILYGENNINVNELSKGLYYYKLIENNQTLSTGKIIFK